MEGFLFSVVLGWVITAKEVSLFLGGGGILPLKPKHSTYLAVKLERKKIIFYCQATRQGQIFAQDGPCVTATWLRSSSRASEQER